MIDIPLRRLVTALCTLTVATATVHAGVGTGTADVKKGIAKLALSAEAIAAFNDAGLFVGRISPGSINFRAGVISVPIVSGAIDTQSARIELASSGGFGFSKNGIKFTIVDLVTSITNGLTGNVTALLTNQGDFQGRVKIADFAVNIPTPIPTTTDKLEIEDVSLKLSAEAAAALNAAFGTTVFQPGQKIARATLTAKIATKRL
jgi:hypothetical protein